MSVMRDQTKEATMSKHANPIVGMGCTVEVG